MDRNMDVITNERIIILEVDPRANELSTISSTNWKWRSRQVRNEGSPININPSIFELFSSYIPGVQRTTMQMVTFRKHC